MSKSDNTKKLLTEAIQAKQTLFDFIDANPKGNGQEALDYMIKRSISKEIALDTVKEYSKAKEDVTGPSIDSTPTVKELDDNGMIDDTKVDTVPDIKYTDTPIKETEIPLDPIVEENDEKVNNLNTYKDKNNSSSRWKIKQYR